MSALLSDAPLAWHLLVLAVAAAMVLAGGVRLAAIADELADRTGMGEIIAGAVFVGGSTSLPGAIASITTASHGYAALAVGNAVGGLTAQTTFLAIADLVYRRANLEHAAASVTGLSQGTLLITLLSIPLLAGSAPPVTLFAVHPATPVLVLVYIGGLRLLVSVKDRPMWSPVATQQTASEVDTPAPGGPSTAALWARFAAYALLAMAGGYLVAEAGEALVEQAGISESAVGTLFMGVANSLPELVTAIAAVMRGAVNLAVGDIIGGNSFEVLFLAAADIFYREGSIYHAFTPDNTFTLALAMLMTGVLLLGMLRRERRGPLGIGFESAIVLALYALGVVVLLA